MTLIEQIKAEYLVQRKARASWQVASLSTLIGEIETLSKGGKGEINDADVVAVVKKFIKNIDETLKVIAPTAVAETALLRSERALYEKFMPRQLTEAELTVEIDAMSANGWGATVGDVMKNLKAHYAGRYDGAMASAILKARFK